MSDKTAFLSALAIRLPGVSLANALGIIEDAERFLLTPAVSAGPDLSTHEGLVAFARMLPEVGINLRAGKKIQAIKELRTKGRDATKGETNPDGYPLVGLKQAKDACDELAKESEYAVTPTTTYCCGKVTGLGHYTWCYNY